MTPCKRLKGFTALIREIIFHRVIVRSVLEIRYLHTNRVLTLYYSAIVSTMNDVNLNNIRCVYLNLRLSTSELIFIRHALNKYFIK